MCPSLCVWSCFNIYWKISPEEGSIHSITKFWIYSSYFKELQYSSSMKTKLVSLVPIICYKLLQWEVLSFYTECLSFFFASFSPLLWLLLIYFILWLCNTSNTFVDNATWNVRTFWNVLAFDFGWTWFYSSGSQKAGSVLPVNGDR